MSSLHDIPRIVSVGPAAAPYAKLVSDGPAGSPTLVIHRTMSPDVGSRWIPARVTAAHVRALLATRPALREHLGHQVGIERLASALRGLVRSWEVVRATVSVSRDRLDGLTVTLPREGGLGNLSVYLQDGFAVREQVLGMLSPGQRRRVLALPRDGQALTLRVEWGLYEALRGLAEAIVPIEYTKH